MKTLSKEINQFKVLLQNIPATCMVFFTVSVVCMNILANKELLSTPWLSLDCGFAMSWIAFLSMDMIIKRFGAKASIQLSLLAEVINLLFSSIFFLLSLVPSNWGAFYTYGDAYINSALNSTIGGTWYVVLGSTTAFVVSAIVNAIINQSIGSKITNDSYKSFALRSFVSTFIGQFVDNLIFAYIVSLNFFGWNHIQCWMCALTGAVVELLCEVLFSPIGYRVSKRWSRHNIGKDYITLVKSN